MTIRLDTYRLFSFSGHKITIFFLNNQSFSCLIRKFIVILQLIIGLTTFSQMNNNNSNNLSERLAALREEMRREGIDACIFPSSDPHGSEYVAPHWQSRQWISGFTGSAGTAVVTLDEAALWTDSRYFLQAAEQLNVGEGTWQLMKEGLPSTPDIIEWLLRKLSVLSGKGQGAAGGVVAIDGMVESYAEVKMLQQQLRRIGATIRTNYDPLSAIWTDRPAVPSGQIRCINGGETVDMKLLRLREVLKANYCDAMVLSDLMQIAWTLNLRGCDIKHTPVFVAYLIVRKEPAGGKGILSFLSNKSGSIATLYCNGPLTEEAKKTLGEVGVETAPYDSFLSKDAGGLAALAASADRIMACSGTLNYTLFNTIKDKAVDLPSPVESMKAIKNPVEIEGFRNAMRRDGVAMVRFLRWLKPAVEAGGQTECSVSDKLEQLRREAPECYDLSFSTIAGYNAHGAIVHYTATPESDARLEPHGLLLVDSGAQYTDGTTDITRTIPLGPLTDEMRRGYTLVLKANIALATTPFPEGVNGTNIDAIARSVLWRGHLSYLHGTGHGVGWCLSVHEGPHSVRLDWRETPLMAGMTITDEPGVYIEGSYGVRIENTMLVVKDCETECGTFLKLEPLTLCPIDLTPVDWEVMTRQEVEWLNSYHQRVRNELLPLLSDEADKAWLIQATEAVELTN